ncbi:hypothetical protein ACE1SV_72880 [Streptomyces sennicomposti]
MRTGRGSRRTRARSAPWIRGARKALTSWSSPLTRTALRRPGDLGAAVLLIRPDGYVRWAADRLADGEKDALLAAVAEGLARTP